MTARRIQSAIAAALALSAATCCGTVQAETTAAPIPEDLESIVVTARRRAENVQEVPIALSVVSAATLEATGSFNVARLQQLQPAIQFYSSNARNSAANIRGLGAPFGLTNDGIEQGVGFYVDDVYYSRSAASTLDFLDVERLEVLRGPQGTLYGKNTTAGTINISTRAPTFTEEGRAEASFGNLGFLQAKASLSGPLLADSLAGRVAFSGTSRNGTLFDVKTGTHINELDNLGFRGQLLWSVSKDLDVTLAADYSLQNPLCCGQVYVRTGLTQRPLNRQYAALSALQNYAVPSTNPFDRVTDLDVPLRARNELGGGSLRARWNLGAGTLTSVTAWRHWDWQPSSDRDYTGLPITTRSENPSRQDQTTQEFRYSYAGKHLDYVIGLFGFTQKVHTDGLQVQGTAASRWLLNPSSAASLNPAELNNLTSVNKIDFSNDSAALFGQLTWHVTDKLRIEPGLRLNFDDKSGSYVATVTNGSNTTLNANQRGVLAPQSYTAKFSDWNLSGDAKLSYAFSHDVLGYASYSRGFKTGGINLNGLPLDAANQPILGTATVKPEKVDNYELGLKTELLNRTVTWNVSAFWTNIGNYQTTVTNGQFAVIRGYLANAAKVRVRGVESDLSIRPTDRLSAYVNAAFTDATYVRFTDAPCPPELSGGTTATSAQTPGAAGVPGALSPANCNISGQWLPGISRWALSYGTQYEMPVDILHRSGKAYAAFDGNYRSRFSSNASRSAYTDIAPYAIANLRFGFNADSGWDIHAWLHNAFGKEYFDQLTVASGNTGLVVGQPADPRTYGLTVTVKF
jgi:iron complex outermembrane receptor protein